MANKKIAEMVAERILAELEKGIIPWRKPWSESGRWAVSHNNGKRYSLLNQLLLGEPGEYITFNQCRAAGGKVKKGAKSKFVVFWSPVVKTETNDAGEELVKKYFVLKYYNVFNLKDCEGVDVKYFKMPELTEHDSVKEAEEIIGLYQENNPELTIERESLSDRAFYSPTFDSITVPMKEQFKSIAEFYSTLFHEMGHSTGHSSRLNRFKGEAAVARFGSEEYSKEELVAEIVSATLMNHIGIETSSSFENSAAYIAGWSKKIKEDPDVIIAAAGKAEKAVQYILGNEEEAA